MAEAFRPGIQGLRAVAVLAVLLFHIWPLVVPGGYVGVDVFFVISGYLITGLLLREVDETGRILVLDFYSRRIRRLLPAATAVLIAVAVCLQFVSPVRWGETGEQIAASALYYQNWWLGVQSVDYLGAENSPGPLQHFWSLSIEEQYYVLWPLAFWIVALAFGRSRISRRAISILLMASVFAASLAYSVYLTPKNPGWAYFATTSRAWELALGGLLAATPRRWHEGLPSLLATILAVTGFGLILFSAFAYSPETVFPGYLALVPTLGAVMVLIGVARARENWIDRILSTSPMQYVGDLSYSLYLWHWPVVVFAYALLGVETFNLVEGLIVATISFALAHFAKAMIEDRWRHPAACGGQRWKTFLLGATCIVLSVAAAFWVFGKVLKAGSSTAESHSAIEAPDSGQGDAGFSFKPSPMDAEGDVGTAYGLRCITTTLGTEVHACVLARNPGGANVVVVGDSHAASWLPAFEVLANERGWNLTAVLKSACTFALFPSEVQHEVEIETMRTCLEWQSKAIPFVAAISPDLLITAHSVSSMSRTESGSDSLVVADAIRAAWGRINASGSTTIVAIADTPRFTFKIPECVGLNAGRAGSCGRERALAVPKRDPLRQAAAHEPGVAIVDLNDRICSPTRCEAVVGGILAWRDAHHMTRTFSESLAGAMGAELDASTGGRFRGN